MKARLKGEPMQVQMIMIEINKSHRNFQGSSGRIMHLLYSFKERRRSQYWNSRVYSQKSTHLWPDCITSLGWENLRHSKSTHCPLDWISSLLSREINRLSLTCFVDCVIAYLAIQLFCFFLFKVNSFHETRFLQSPQRSWDVYFGLIFLPFSLIACVICR